MHGAQAAGPYAHASRRPRAQYQCVRDQRAGGFEVRDVIGKLSGQHVGEQLHRPQSPLEFRSCSVPRSLDRLFNPVLGALTLSGTPS